MSYTFEQFYVSTADDELNYFTDVPGDQTPSQPAGSLLTPGTYGVRDGQLYLVAPSESLINGDAEGRTI